MRRRALLVRLVVDANQVVPSERLIDDLWGDRLPEHPANALQACMSHLRSVLEPGRSAGTGSTVLVTRRPGYGLMIEPMSVDAFRFGHLAAEGRGALVDGRVAQASASLTDALTLWRGPALAEFADESWAHAEASRLEELRWATLEDRMEADLALGRHGAVVGDAEAAVAEQPMRERLWAHRMLALYRCGRQAEALRAYAELRRALVDDLGIEPSPELAGLESAILLQSPELDWQPTGQASGSANGVSAHLTGESSTNLPASRSSFVGRQAEMEELDKLVAVGGLVTVVGPGGVGKTRVSLVVAARVRARFLSGVWLVDLASVGEPALVAQSVAQALDVREEPGRPLVETLARSISGRRLLLMLDNCEHLVGAAAELADALLDASPGLTILATSREPLRVQGEHVFVLAPLPLPVYDDLPPEVLSTVDAVRLFADRAAAQGSFSLTTENAVAVAGLCRRLDGLPLAIELAAARVRTLTPSQVLARLDDRFALLTSGARTAVPRHQTLRAAIDWSHDLLAPAERTLFRRLGVFAGSFGLDTVAAVCAGTDDVAAADVIGLVGALVDHSLVVPVDIGGERRFALLETLRAYAAEQLAEAGEAEAIHERLLRWAIAFAESFAHALATSQVADKLAFERIDVERENLRQALGWAVPARPDLGLRLLEVVSPYLTIRGFATEARKWASILLAATPDTPSEERGKLLRMAGSLALQVGDMGCARPLLEQALGISRQRGDPENTAIVLVRLARIAEDHLGDLLTSERLLREANDIYAKEGNDHLQCEGLGFLSITMLRRGEVAEAQGMIEQALGYNLRHAEDPCKVLFGSAGLVALLQGHHDRARGLLERALADNREVGVKSKVPRLLGWLGDLAVLGGDHAEASDRYAEQLAIATEIGNGLQTASALSGLAMAAIYRGDSTYARSAMDRSVRIARSTGRAIVPDDLDAAAALVHGEGCPADAAQILGAAETHRQACGMPVPPAFRTPLERLVAEVSGALDPDSLAEAWEAGRRLCAEEALAIAFPDPQAARSTRFVGSPMDPVHRVGP